MRDDINPGNIGRASKIYDETFFWNSYRKMELFFSQILSKGPIKVASIEADSITFPGSAALNDYQANTFIPSIIGSTTAGTGTYTVRNGRYTKIGRLVFLEIDITWTAHTGTGNIWFNLPFTAAGTINSLLHIAVDGLSFPNQLRATVIFGTATGQVVSISTSGAISAVAMDTAARLLISGCYVV